MLELSVSPGIHCNLTLKTKPLQVTPCVVFFSSLRFTNQEREGVIWLQVAMEMGSALSWLCPQNHRGACMLPC